MDGSDSDEDLGELLFPQADRNRQSTGIDVLDTKLGGGVPAGRTVAFVSPPGNQSELLVKQLLTQRPSLYVSTLRPKWEIEEELRGHLQRSGSVDLGSDPLRIESVSPESALERPTDVLEGLESGSNLVIDAVNDLEHADRDRYAAFVNAVKRQVWETGSVGLFYGIEGEHTPQCRTITLRSADLIFRLHSSVDSRQIVHYLEVSKFRSGRALTEPITLDLTDEVQIDTSSDIG